MLEHGRLPLTPAENDAINDLIGKHPRAGEATVGVSLTRRDPGELGPVLVHVHRLTDGETIDEFYEVDAEGRVSDHVPPVGELEQLRRRVAELEAQLAKKKAR